MNAWNRHFLLERLSFPVPSSKEELMKTIRPLAIKPSQVHQFLVWLHGVLRKITSRLKLREEETWRPSWTAVKINWIERGTWGLWTSRMSSWSILEMRRDFTTGVRPTAILILPEIAQGRSRNPSAPKELIPGWEQKTAGIIIRTLTRTRSSRIMTWIPWSLFTSGMQKIRGVTATLIMDLMKGLLWFPGSEPRHNWRSYFHSSQMMKRVAC